MAKRYKRSISDVKISSKDKLFKQVQRDVIEANRRLDKLSRGYDVGRAVRNPKTGRFERKTKEKQIISYTTGTWASKKLMNRLDSATMNAWQNGRVKINKNMTMTQLKAVQKATGQFLKSKTSSIKGIESTKKETIKSIKESLSDDMESKVTDEDAEFYYDMLGEDDFDFFADKIGASTLWTLIDEAITSNASESGWINILSRYIMLDDIDIKAKAINLYNKYIG